MKRLTEWQALKVKKLSFHLDDVYLRLFSFSVYHTALLADLYQILFALLASHVNIEEYVCDDQQYIPLL